jgi:hypothetical protein
MRVHLENTQALLDIVVAKPSFISTAHGLLRAMGHVSSLEPTIEEGAV